MRLKCLIREVSRLTPFALKKHLYILASFGHKVLLHRFLINTSNLKAMEIG